MPRSPRLECPGRPLHVTRRDVNRCAIFVDDLDRRHFYDLLRAAMAEHEIAVHAYVLMGNHVHLLLSPPPGAGSVVARHAKLRAMLRAGIQQAAPAQRARYGKVRLPLVELR